MKIGRTMKFFLAAAFISTFGCATVATQDDLKSLPVDGAPKKYENTFSMGYEVSTNVKASPKKIWKILTDAPAYPKWNSTVISVAGKIGKDEDIVLKAKIAPDRDFELHVDEFLVNQKMVWKDGTAGIFKGVRTFLLAPQKDGSTNVSMVENFAGAMLPMIKGSLPEFTASFRDFAADLKRQAEKP